VEWAAGTTTKETHRFMYPAFIRMTASRLREQEKNPERFLVWRSQQGADRHGETWTYLIPGGGKLLPPYFPHFLEIAFSQRRIFALYPCFKI